MTIEQTRRSLTAALTNVRHPVTGRDVVSSGHVQGLEVQEGGEVRFSFVLQPDDPGSLVKEVRAAAEAAEGVTSVKVNVQLPRTPASGPAKKPLKPGSVPAPTPKPGLLPEVSHVIAVSSGKGGVGKSMMAANLAAGAAASGLHVGLLDADIYGPNIPLMFGETRRPRVTGPQGKERIEPLESHGVRLMSLGFLLEKEQPAIMRGPLISGILKQFLEQVEWGALDLLVVDMPPGTGDAQLSLVQTIDLDGVVMVTTPQEVATGDVRRGVRMFERVNTRVLGIVENMSGFVCPHCDEITEIFGSGGGERLAAELGLPFLGRVPLDAAVAASGDQGTPTVLAAPHSPAGRALQETVRTVIQSVQGAVARG
jgi:ATP-binding protein involved in chromosome partitioning